MNRKEKKHPLNIIVGEDVYITLRDIGDVENCSVSEIVRKMIEYGIAIRQRNSM